MVPTFTWNRLTGEAPSFAPAASPRLRRRPSPWPPGRRHQPAREFSAPKGPDARCCPTQICQIRAGGSLLRSVRPLVSHVHLPVLLAGPRPSGSADPSRRCRGCLPPSRPSRRSGCPQLAPARCDRPTAVSFHHRTVHRRLVALDLPGPEQLAADSQAGLAHLVLDPGALGVEREVALQVRPADLSSPDRQMAVGPPAIRRHDRLAVGEQVLGAVFVAVGRHLEDGVAVGEDAPQRALVAAHAPARLVDERDAVGAARRGAAVPSTRAASGAGMSSPSRSTGSARRRSSSRSGVMTGSPRCTAGRLSPVASRGSDGHGARVPRPGGHGRGAAACARPAGCIQARPRPARRRALPRGEHEDLAVKWPQRGKRVTQALDAARDGAPRIGRALARQDRHRRRQCGPPPSGAPPVRQHPPRHRVEPKHGLTFGNAIPPPPRHDEDLGDHLLGRRAVAPSQRVGEDVRAVVGEEPLEGDSVVHAIAMSAHPAILTARTDASPRAALTGPFVARPCRRPPRSRRKLRAVPRVHGGLDRALIEHPWSALARSLKLSQR
ncbi:MAG: hypothetical protein JWO74_1587 [Solirubrobacterales bacterium]|nr:hypothetical protein [Solirubrobacterales bacterium]